MRYLLMAAILFCGPLIIRADNAKPTQAEKLKDRLLRSMDDVKAFFDAGIRKKPLKPVKHQANSATGHNRIYKASEITSKFGEPLIRKEIAPTERWSFDCSNGVCELVFTPRGFASDGSQDADARLEIQRIVEITGDQATAVRRGASRQ